MSKFFQYLKQLKVDVDPRLVFVAMPFAPLLGKNYVVIKKASLEAGMTVRRSGDIYTSQAIMNNVVDLILRCG